MTVVGIRYPNPDAELLHAPSVDADEWLSYTAARELVQALQVPPASGIAPADHWNATRRLLTGALLFAERIEARAAAQVFREAVHAARVQQELATAKE